MHSYDLLPMSALLTEVSMTESKTTPVDEAIEIIGLVYHNYRWGMAKDHRAKLEKVFKEFYQQRKGTPYYERI